MDKCKIELYFVSFLLTIALVILFYFLMHDPQTMFEDLWTTQLQQQHLLIAVLLLLEDLRFLKFTIKSNGLQDILMQ